MPSRMATPTRREFLFRNSYPRYASVGVPAGNTSRAVDRLTSLRNRPRKADGTVCATACYHCFVFSSFLVYSTRVNRARWA